MAIKKLTSRCCWCHHKCLTAYNTFLHQLPKNTQIGRLYLTTKAIFFHGKTHTDTEMLRQKSQELSTSSGKYCYTELKKWLLSIKFSLQSGARTFILVVSYRCLLLSAPAANKSEIHLLNMWVLKLKMYDKAQVTWNSICTHSRNLVLVVHIRVPKWQHSDLITGSLKTIDMEQISKMGL